MHGLCRPAGSPLLVQRALSPGLQKPVTGFPMSRNFSSLPPFSLNRIQPAPKHPQQSQIRAMMSFGGAPSQSTLYRAEQVANNSPQNAYAQERFYDLLLRAGLPQVIAERYQSGNFASNKGCDEKYNRAVEKLSVSEDSPLTMDGTAAYAGGRSLGPEKAQAIGQAVAARSRGGNVSINHGKNSGGGGGREDPIYVVVDESIGGAVFKWIKFLFYFALVALFT